MRHYRTVTFFRRNGDRGMQAVYACVEKQGQDINMLLKAEDLDHIANLNWREYGPWIDPDDKYVDA